jgi:hypothetical protein
MAWALNKKGGIREDASLIFIIRDGTNWLSWPALLADPVGFLYPSQNPE